MLHIPCKATSRYARPHYIGLLLVASLSICLIHVSLLALPLASRLSKSAEPYDLLLSSALPSPSAREGDDTLDSVDPRWRAFRPLTPPGPPFPRLEPTRFLPPTCLEQWFEEGVLHCGTLGEEDKLDVVWLWVNGSDGRWKEITAWYLEQEGVDSGAQHFRENNELKYSMRSVAAALPGRVGTVHLVTADYHFENPDDLRLVPDTVLRQLEQDVGDRYRSDMVGHSRNSSRTAWGRASPALASHLASTWRIAQSPTWLDYSRLDQVELDFPKFRYTAHSELFHLPSAEHQVTEPIGWTEDKELTWRYKALPTFNSNAIEGQIGWIPGLSDVILAMNDDLFLLRPHAVSDFHSPLYGPIIHFDQEFENRVQPELGGIGYTTDEGGLLHANYVLSKRFFSRDRHHLAHIAKVVTRGLYHEASLMFNKTLFLSAQRRFREVERGDGDIHMQWLVTALRVERWREALLWTYIVANIGTFDSGLWGAEARKEIADLFGLRPGREHVVEVKLQKGERWTLSPYRIENVFKQAGWEPPRVTEMLFSSMDGHLPNIQDPDKAGNEEQCTFRIDQCFGSFWTNQETVPAIDIFKRLTFERPECGDCMIIALVTASGPLGLSAFFPPGDKSYTNVPLFTEESHPRYIYPPHLPLTSTWEDADFSLENVLSTTALPGEDVNLRRYCMKLLSRYLYVSAKSDSRFYMLNGVHQAEEVFEELDDSPEASILGLNDDIEADYELTVGVMKNWFAARWPEKLPWERD